MELDNSVSSVNIRGYTSGDSRAKHPDFNWTPGHFEGVFELDPGESTINIDVISPDSSSVRYSIQIRKTDANTNIEEIADQLPAAYKLNNNYPNPFNPSTKINFAIPENSTVKLIVYNLLGEEVSILVNKELSAGIYEYTWNAGKLSSGIYIYRLITNKFISTKKMVLLR